MPSIIKIISINGTRDINLDGFNKDVVSFGRSSECDIQLNVEYVSRLHGCFYKENGNWFFKDMNSTHGIFFRGAKTDSSILSNNDELLLLKGSNSNDVVRIVFTRMDDMPYMSVNPGMSNIYCSNCGQPVAVGEKFCSYCGANVENAALVSGYAQNQKKSGKKKNASGEKRKNGVFGVLDFALGLGALLGFITIVILCQEMGLDFTIVMICIAGGVGVIGAIFFIFSKKGRLSKLGFIFSLVAIALVLCFIFVLIPVQKNRISKNYMKELKNCLYMDDSTRETNYRNNTSHSFNAYPYRSVNRFYKEEQEYYKDVENYLIKLYEDKKYDEWIAGCNYVNNTINWCIFDDSDFLDKIWDDSNPVDTKGLIEYDILFENSPFAESDARGASVTRSEINRLNELEWNMYLTDYNSDGLQFRIHGNYLIGRYESYKGVGFEVIDLRNGKYFYGGQWHSY